MTLLSFFLLGFSLQAAPAKSVPVVAKVSSLSGNVLFKPEGSSSFRKVVVGMALSEKDVIKTGENAWVSVFFRNGSVIRVVQNSEVLITKAADKKGLRAEFKIPESGKVLATVKKLAKEKNDVRFQTATAVVGVRGTSLSVNAINKDRSVVAVFEGKVIVQDFVSESGLSTDNNKMLLDFLREVVVNSDQATEYNRAKGLSKPVPLDAAFDSDKAIIRELDEESQKQLEETKRAGKEAVDGEARELRAEAIAQE